MTVRREDLDRNIAVIRGEIDDPRGGVYGAGSVGWTVGREGILFLGAGCAALLQLAHPFVAHAIDKQSRTRTDPLGRFVGTFDYVYRILFGSLDEALSSARRVFRIHERVQGVIDEDVGRFAHGSRYEALDESALFWVHATLEHTAVDVFERVVRPLSQEEKSLYNRGSNRFAALFGVPFERLPRSWETFEETFARVVDSDEIAVGRPAREIAHALLHPASPKLARFAAWFRIMTAGLLPERLRRPYDLPFGPRERRIFSTSVRALRVTRRATPDALAFVPAYHDAAKRARGGLGRARLAVLMERALERGARLAR